jgi:excinuclease ABC subunit A
LRSSKKFSYWSENTCISYWVRSRSSTGIFTPIRELFAGTQEARAKGYKPGRFSFNVRGGRCEACEGDGMIKVEMHFLPDVYVKCDVCNGKRYNNETFEILYKGKNISDILNFSVRKALDFFDAVPVIKRKNLGLYGLKSLRYR